jgi:thiamine pyrophosphokinase
LLSKYAEQNNVRILSDNGIFIPISKPTVFQSFKGQQVSIFSQSPEVEISSEGLKYPLQNLKLNSWWMGTLNESISEEFTIRFKDNARLIIYLLNK